VLGKQEFRKCETPYSVSAVVERPAEKKDEKREENAKW
jgi:hypothetical protein